MAKSGKGKKKKKEKHDLIYIMNPNCGWCKKADPVVESLIKKGYEITTLDVTKPEQAERANEIKSKHNAQCGTPLFLDAETGNQVCGFREDVLEDWAKGKEIPAPKPRPNSDRKRPERHKLEYIWLDGNDTKRIRSKVRYSMLAPTANVLPSIPEWSFDGSSTNQADTENSDCVLKPVKVFPNPMESRNLPTYYVLCEVMNPDGTPHESNTRAKLKDAILKSDVEQHMFVGIEQEYIITDPRTNKPLGWDKYDGDTPPPQGKYYCGVGAETNVSRNLAEAHANMCIQSGISIDGFHPEVMLSQWEYQTGVGTPLDISDNLWMSRFLLQRVGERMDVSVSYDPKPVDGDWNGSGAHINFSNRGTREDEELGYINILCMNLQESHSEAIAAYGIGNHKRLTGNHETSSVEKFSFGEGDRSASIRIPVSTANNGRGHIEDRRPSANMDPYEALTYLVSSISKINKELMVAT